MKHTTFFYPNSATKTAAEVSSTDPLLDDDPGVKHSFRAEASLPLTECVPIVPYDTTRPC